MFSSSRDMMSSNSFKNISAEAESLSSREFMGSDLFLKQQSSSSGLARYRSAPSSFLAALLDSTTDNSSSGDESEAIFSALMNQNDTSSNRVKAETEEEVVGSVNGSGQMGYEDVVNASVVGSYSAGMETQLINLRSNNNNGSNLVRQTSSPAGFFNGFGVMGEVGSYRVENHAKQPNINSSSSTSGGMSNHHMNFTSAGPSSSSIFMPTIPENGNEQTRHPQNVQLRNLNSAAGEFEAVFHEDSWNSDSPFNSLKRSRDFNGLEHNQDGETRKRSSGLVHHLSLPKTCAEMAEVEKFLQFQQDPVPLQIRAKRGCATHPRSIAERVRRTRISEKMRKLQDLFPNMDKQTSTADMLDSAVEFIKDLQKQVQTLTDTKAKCICSNKH